MFLWGTSHYLSSPGGGGGGGGGAGAARMIFWTPPFEWCFTEVILLVTLDKFRDSPQNFRPPPKKKSSSTTGRKKESKRKVQKNNAGRSDSRHISSCETYNQLRLQTFISKHNGRIYFTCFKLVLLKQILVVPWILLHFFYDLRRSPVLFS